MRTKNQPRGELIKHKLTTVYLYPNGQIRAFDQIGRPMTYYTGHKEDVLDRIFEDYPYIRIIERNG